MKIGILLGQNVNIFLPEEDVRYGNIRIRKSRLGDYSYIPDGSDESLWNFKTTRKTFIPHMFPQNPQIEEVKSSSSFSLSPDLPWNLLPQFNPCKAVPPLLRFVKEGYTKIVQSQGQNENQENQNAFPLSNLGTTLQVMVPTYTACLSIFKMMTTFVSLRHKAEILITVNLKSSNEGCTKTGERKCIVVLLVFILSLWSNNLGVAFFNETKELRHCFEGIEPW